MERLGQQHIEFLQLCAGKPSKIHESDIPLSELQQMVDEGLLIKYNSGVKPKYCATKLGVRLAKSFGASPELIKVAEDFVVSKGYTPEAAKSIVEKYGAEVILKSENNLDERQREVKIPLDAQGRPQINPIKST